MGECDFCSATLDGTESLFSKKEIGRVAAKHATIGDFANNYGISSQSIAKLYVKLNHKQATAVALCPDCADKIPQHKPWWRLWK